MQTNKGVYRTPEATVTNISQDIICSSPFGTDNVVGMGNGWDEGGIEQ